MKKAMYESIAKLIIALVIIAIGACFKWWLADGNARCFFAQDAATCATIRETKGI